MGNRHFLEEDQLNANNFLLPTNVPSSLIRGVDKLELSA